MNYEELTVINPDNLPVKRILIAWGNAIALPENAVVIWEDVKGKRHIPHILIDGKEYKLCAKCRKWVRIWEYYKCSGNKDGLMNSCVDCSLLQRKVWYAKKLYPGYYKQSYNRGV